MLAQARRAGGFRRDPYLVGGHDNGHTARSYGNPIGVECEGCGRRALVQLDRLGGLRVNMRPLRDFPFKCSACGLRDVSLWLLRSAPRPTRGRRNPAGFLTAAGRRGPVTEMFCVRPAARLYCRHGGRQQLWRGRHRVRDMQASRGVPGRLRAGRDKRPFVADDRPAVPELPIGNHVGLAAVRDAGRG
jgi:hypothetical protein